MRKIIDILFISIIILTIVGSAFFIFNQPSDDIWYGSMDLGLFVCMVAPLLIIELGLYYNCVYFSLRRIRKRGRRFLMY